MCWVGLQEESNYATMPRGFASLKAKADDLQRRLSTTCYGPILWERRLKHSYYWTWLFLWCESWFCMTISTFIILLAIWQFTLQLSMLWTVHSGSRPDMLVVRFYTHAPWWSYRCHLHHVYERSLQWCWDWTEVVTLDGSIRFLHHRHIPWWQSWHACARHLDPRQKCIFLIHKYQKKNAFLPWVQMSKPLGFLFQNFKDDKREYRELINKIKQCSFTPLVFSSFGAMGNEATVMIKKLSDATTTRNNEMYSCVVGWMRCLFSILSGKVCHSLCTCMWILLNSSWVSLWCASLPALCWGPIGGVINSKFNFPYYN